MLQSIIIQIQVLYLITTLRYWYFNWVFPFCATPYFYYISEGHILLFTLLHWFDSCTFLLLRCYFSDSHVCITSPFTLILEVCFDDNTSLLSFKEDLECRALTCNAVFLHYVTLPLLKYFTAVLVSNTMYWVDGINWVPFCFLVFP